MDDRFFGPVFTDEELDDFIAHTAGDDFPYLADDDIDPDVSDIIEGWA
ncbi:hypothetical protein [Methylosinus sp. PW1]|nr:hypothetical protein [Methylosinus sp. PW1]